MGRQTMAKLVNLFDNKDRLSVLGIIDRLRELGGNEDISLPQLVVVGDQSSGKSSLLEGLTGLSFPIASELCTRFATQIVLRRDSAEEFSVKVSIIPGSAANEKQREHLLKFGKIFDDRILTAKEFASILDNAAVHMGLPSGKDGNLENLQKRFSDDILKIELRRPDYHHLSVVDVPGLFHNPTKFQTKEDLKIIRALIESYITNQRTIVLAVMDGRNNLARSADPQGMRTVGVITNCDTLQRGDEDGVLKIALNLVERLTHGWFAMTNRSTEDIQNGVSIEERHANERHFFTTSPWNTLPKDRVSIAALKEFLGKLLYNHIRGEFPALVQEIRNLMDESRKELELLGPSRQTIMEQRQFLTRLAAKYQRAVLNSLTGNYGSTWEVDDSRKLRMHLHTSNEAFKQRISRYGHTRAFRTVNDEVDKAYFRKGKDEDNIYDWIRELYRQSRGAELPGTVSPNLLEGMFRQQSKKWAVLAAQHIAEVDTIVSNFNTASFVDIISDDTTREKIEARNNAVCRGAKNHAIIQLSRILADEMGGILQTVNDYFADTLSSTREKRVLSRLQGLVSVEGGLRNVNLAQIAGAVHLSHEDQAVNDIHDILKAYYRVALGRFTDNVVKQVVERYYVGSDGPVKSFSPEYIGTLTEAELTNIAAENYATSSVRNDLTSKVDRLEKALSVAENEKI